MKILAKEKIKEKIDGIKGLQNIMLKVFSEMGCEEVIVNKVYDEGNVVITHAQVKIKGQYFTAIDRFTNTKAE